MGLGYRLGSYGFWKSSEVQGVMVVSASRPMKKNISTAFFESLSMMTYIKLKSQKFLDFENN